MSDKNDQHFYFEVSYSGDVIYRQSSITKWSWLPSGYIGANIKALQDTLRKCDCLQKRDESFIEKGLQYIQTEEERRTAQEKESKLNGTDMFMD